MFRSPQVQTIKLLNVNMREYTIGQIAYTLQLLNKVIKIYATIVKKGSLLHDPGSRLRKYRNDKVPMQV